MERNGQIFIVAGVVLSLGAVILSRTVDAGKDWVDFLTGLLTGMASAFIVFGIIRLIPRKSKNK